MSVHRFAELACDECLEPFIHFIAITEGQPAQKLRRWAKEKGWHWGASTHYRDLCGECFDRLADQEEE